MASFWIGVVALAGCAQLAGIDETNNTGLANTVALRRLSIGTRVGDAPLVLTGLSADYLVPDGGGVERVPATADPETGIWSARLAAPTPVQLTMPDVPAPLPRWLSFPNRALRVPFVVLEHPDPDPSPEMTTVELTVPFEDGAPPINPNDERFLAYTIGSWTQHLVPMGSVPMTPPLVISYPFDSSVRLTPGELPDRITGEDVILVLRYFGAALTGFARAPQVEQSTDAGQTLKVMLGAMTAVDTAKQMLDVTLDPAELASRFTSVTPMVGVPEMRWSLIAAPGYLYGNDAGPVLQSADLSTSDLGITATYDNPFEWNTLLAVRTKGTRVAVPTGMTAPVTLNAELNLFLEPPAERAALEFAAGLPERIEINGQPFTVDRQTIKPPTQPVEIAIVIAGERVCTLYEIEVVELGETTVPAGDTTVTVVTRTTVQLAASDQPTFHVPPEKFRVGSSYTVRATCTSGGYPAIATGDLTMRSLPFSQALLDSAVFSVDQ